MLSIVNERGVPGAAGAIAYAHDGARHLLTCHHVLYADGAGDGDRVRLVLPRPGGRSYTEIGRTRGGWIGRVGQGAEVFFIDCAPVLLHPDDRLPAEAVRALGACASLSAVAEPRVGQPVHKHGRITGRTRGVIADTAHYERPFIGGREYDAPGQLLIRPQPRDHCFSAPGESGAAVLDDRDRVVGFLWGANTNGEGVAFPAHAALAQLGLTPGADHHRRYAR